MNKGKGGPDMNPNENNERDDNKDIVESGPYSADTTDPEIMIAAQVADTLADELKNTSSSVETAEAIEDFSAAVEAVVATVDESKMFADALKDSLGDASAAGQIKKDRLTSAVTDAYRSAVAVTTTSDPDDGPTLETGLALDQYLETRVDRIVLRPTTDAAGERVMSMHLQNGSVLVFDADEKGAYFDRRTLWKRLFAECDGQLCNIIASDRLQEDRDLDPDSDAYRELSWGPPERNWSDEKGSYELCIGHLIDDVAETDEPMYGPRTDALDRIAASVLNGRAVTNVDDAVRYGLPFVSETKREIWVPIAVVADAVEAVDATRRDIYLEITERDIDTAELSGDRLRDDITKNGVKQVFWRIKANSKIPIDDALENATESITTETDRVSAASVDSNSDGDDDSNSGDGPAVFGVAPDEHEGNEHEENDE